MNARILQADEISFDSDVLGAEGPVLVDYWAEWCGPCRMLAPVLDEVSDAYADRLTVVKVNVDENRELLHRYGVRGIPTLMLFQDGEIVGTRVGALSRTELDAFLHDSL